MSRLTVISLIFAIVLSGCVRNRYMAEIGGNLTPVDQHEGGTLEPAPLEDPQLPLLQRTKKSVCKTTEAVAEVALATASLPLYPIQILTIMWAYADAERKGVRLP